MNLHKQITLASGLIHSQRVGQAAKLYQKSGMIRTRINRSVLPGRNEPCPCKSGKKFKACCMTGVHELHHLREAKVKVKAEELCQS